MQEHSKRNNDNLQKFKYIYNLCSLKIEIPYTQTHTLAHTGKKRRIHSNAYICIHRNKNYLTTAVSCRQFHINSLEHLRVFLCHSSNVKVLWQGFFQSIFESFVWSYVSFTNFFFYTGNLVSFCFFFHPFQLEVGEKEVCFLLWAFLPFFQQSYHKSVRRFLSKREQSLPTMLVAIYTLNARIWKEMFSSNRLCMSWASELTETEIKATKRKMKKQRKDKKTHTDR